MLKDLLNQKKIAILTNWRDLVFATYHPESAKFLNKDDQFRNPVGYTIARELENLYDGLVAKVNRDRFSPSLDNIVKIRAVQDFTPSQAIGFVFLLKQAIREELKEGIHDPGIFDELSAFESEIDRLALYTFDVYVECREKIHEIRVAEIKKKSSLWEREKNMFADQTENNENG